MSKVILVNPANSTVGYSVITPRWLFVMAGATPTSLVGDPVIVDVPVTPFNAEDVNPGDIVGVGIHSGNCLPGYRIVREANSAERRLSSAAFTQPYSRKSLCKWE